MTGVSTVRRPGSGTRAVPRPVRHVDAAGDEQGASHVAVASRSAGAQRPILRPGAPCLYASPTLFGATTDRYPGRHQERTARPGWLILPLLLCKRWLFRVWFPTGYIRFGSTGRFGPKPQGGRCKPARFTGIDRWPVAVPRDHAGPTHRRSGRRIAVPPVDRFPGAWSREAATRAAKDRRTEFPGARRRPA